MDSLHELHLDAGLPSLAKNAKKSKEINSDLSKSTISYLMSEPRLPDFDGMQKLVAVLVQLPPVSKPMNLDTTLPRFIALWKEAAKAEHSPPPSSRVQELTKTGNAYLKVAAAYQRAEKMEANAATSFSAKATRSRPKPANAPTPSGLPCNRHGPRGLHTPVRCQGVLSCGIALVHV